MKDRECRDFLEWALPRMGFRPAGFRRVRGQVCKRIARRLRELGLSEIDAYRRLLEADPAEWSVCESFCRITISRFNRDAQIFEWLEREALPELAGRVRDEGRAVLRCWSAGCGGGEEPYTLRILWDLRLSRRLPEMGLDIIATDADPIMLMRARRAIYKPGSLRELPKELAIEAFDPVRGEYRLRDEYRAGIRFLRQDIRRRMPPGPFDLILCRNLAFTYFDEAAQRRVLKRLERRMVDDGILLVGCKERLPADSIGFRADRSVPGAYRYNAPA
jgi:chemotaxis protein methyltransferase CheR